MMVERAMVRTCSAAAGLGWWRAMLGGAIRTRSGMIQAAAAMDTIEEIECVLLWNNMENDGAMSSISPTCPASSS
jgi:hypothetical protein